MGTIDWESVTHDRIPKAVKRELRVLRKTAKVYVLLRMAERAREDVRRAGGIPDVDLGRPPSGMLAEVMKEARERWRAQQQADEEPDVFNMDADEYQRYLAKREKPHGR